MATLDELLFRLSRLPAALGPLAQLDGIWLVGGFLRRAWHGQAGADLDFSIAARDGLSAHERIDAAIAELGADAIVLGERFGARRAVLETPEGRLQLDFSPLHEGGLEADLLRRDYTANTLCVPLARCNERIRAEDIASAPGALDDLAAGRLRMLGADNIAADPLRILRGYRLCATAGLRPDLATRRCWHELAASVTLSAPERIHEELLAWFGAPVRRAGSRDAGLSVTLRWAAEDTVLWRLFPELAATAGCAQNAYHHLDVWAHTLLALQELDALFAELPAALDPHSEALAAHWAAEVSGAADAWRLTRLALLLHDCAKPATREVQPDGRVTFHNHQEQGAQDARQALERLKFSRAETDYVALLVAEHLRLGYYTAQLPLSSRLVYRFISRLGSATAPMLLHSLADCRATRGEGWELSEAQHIEGAARILEHYFAQDSAAAPPLLLDGGAIMALLGLPPGPRIGELKEALLEATAAGEVSTRAEAEAYVRRLGAAAP